MFVSNSFRWRAIACIARPLILLEALCRTLLFVHIGSLLIAGCDDDPCGEDADCTYQACLKAQQWARKTGHEEAASGMQCVPPLPRTNQ